jgi:ribosomal protein L11 methyltransferase
VIEALVNHGSPGVEESGEDLIAHFRASSAIDAISSAIHAADASAGISVSPGHDADWSRWRADVSAHRVGSLTIAPPWLAEASDPSTTVVIDPAMAFGTGEHATTRGVIRLMHRVVDKNSVVADVGAGSAVLSIAAAKLGAARVVAIEVDPDAEGNALENIRLNGVGDRVHYVTGDALVLLPLVAPVTLILANILSSVPVELLPVMHGSLTAGGCAILSGVLKHERQMTVEEVTRGGWRVDAEDTEEDWWSVLIVRP